MAEASRARPTPLHPGLPDEIFIWEVLIRLPPKALLRCRAVCRGWRRATSSRDFLLAHHGRQPSLPLLYVYDHTNTDDGGSYLDIVPLDHRAGVAAADQLQSVARVASSDSLMRMEASCDGLLIVGTAPGDCYGRLLSVCNPATRQHAPLPLLRGFGVAGMYPHPPTGEYRLLLYPDDLYESPPSACYIYALGSCEPPRHIGWQEVEEVIHALEPVHFHGNLHWFIENDESESDSDSGMIMVFDSTAELFRHMRAPAVPGVAELFEMDEMMGMASFDEYVTTIDIWMMQEYDSEEWAFKYRIELPVAELTLRFGFGNDSNLVLSSWGDDALVLVQSGEWLLQVGIDGKLIATFQRKLLGTTQFRLKQSLVPHAFFPTLEGHVVNTWPFVSPDDSVVNT